MDLLRLQAAPLSLDEAVGHVAHPRAGGTGVFIGTVRDDDVTHLEYEAYEEAVGPALRRVAEAVRGAIPATIKLAMLHRVGALAIGESAVVVAASAPHRAEAFAAARMAIDLIKAEVPIWKKEHRTDGTAEWVACHSPGGVGGMAARTGPAAEEPDVAGPESCGPPTQKLLTS